MLYRVNEKWDDGKICDRINNDLWNVCHAAEQILMIVEIYNHDEFDYIYFTTYNTAYSEYLDLF